MNSVEQETTKALESLSLEELSLLNERKETLKKDHAAYVGAHPEIKTLLSNFMSALLLEKPQDVLAFAIEHFSAFQPSTIELQPIVIAGPSGVGKGTLINMLLEKFPDAFGFSVSHTTRDPREGEKCMEIYIQGVQQVKKSGIEAKYLFIAPPSIEELEQRLRGRGTETEEKIDLRLNNAAGEMEFSLQPGAFDAILVNNVVEDSFDELVSKIKEWYPTVELE
ncbi:guanylate kinase [Plasmopara halstedii]|uniref:Guanylate kinase n=1 Tax=Plasmopara halstedii TaxID=4781 RepID=A0A0P1AJ75_PLAHL|nr:guanylate kinase [Plasmopara halstedii]CEG41282.1 guanylate kinase [Plasmopara halstedii]|eukprot:XP_024577651.1 guanylate kinase [Plasmopara halstedii]